MRCRVIFQELRQKTVEINQSTVQENQGFQSFRRLSRVQVGTCSWILQICLYRPSKMVESKPIDGVFASRVIPPLATKPTWPLIPSAIQCLCLCVHKVFELCVHSVCNPEAIFIFMFLYSERRPALPCRLAKRGSVRGISNSISKANIFYQEQALFVFLFVFVLLCFSLMFLMFYIVVAVTILL